MKKPKISENSRIHRPARTKPPLAESDNKGKRRARNAGKLAQLLDMPLDIFFEVCTFHCLSSKDSLPTFYVNSKITSKLKPLDLLQLSRVSKQFRNTFMSKSSRYVWIEARKNVHGMPDPPDCLPEPKYASVVFERNCFVSAQSKAVVRRSCSDTLIGLWHQSFSQD